jgi:hypothetical protein
MDCREVTFVPQKSEERIKKAMGVFELEVLWRVFAFALYMFGARRRIIAELLGIPEESLKTTIRVVLRDGFPAFLDRRRSEVTRVAEPSKTTARVSVRRDGKWIVVDFDSNIGELRIPAAHEIQVRTVLLSLLNSGLLSTRETASILGVSPGHCRKLAEKLASNDVGESLIDKRRGQRQDYRVGSVQKAEIIQQFAARAVCGLSTASDVLAEVVNEQTKAELSPRTVRWHMNKLGLAGIKKTLPNLVDTLKKTPEAASRGRHQRVPCSAHRKE